MAKKKPVVSMPAAPGIVGTSLPKDVLQKLVKAIGKPPSKMRPCLNLSLCDKAYIAGENQAIVSGTYNLLRLTIPEITAQGLPVPPLRFYFKLQAFVPGTFHIAFAVRVIVLNGKADGKATPVLGMRLSIPPGNELAGDGTHDLPLQFLARSPGREFVTGGENRATLQLEGWVDGILANAQRVTISWLPATPVAHTTEAPNHVATPGTRHDAPGKR